jgi:hypothetical protein
VYFPKHGKIDAGKAECILTNILIKKEQEIGK